MARTVIPALAAALIAPSADQPVRFRIQKGIQSLLDCPPHYPVQVTPDPFVVDLDDIAQNFSIIPAHGGSSSRLNGLVVADCHSSPSRGRLPNPNLRKKAYVIQLLLHRPAAPGPCLDNLECGEPRHTRMTGHTTMSSPPLPTCKVAPDGGIRRVRAISWMI